MVDDSVLRVEPEKIRQLVGEIKGYSQVAYTIPKFMAGGAGSPASVWLTPTDLGDVPPFYQQWVMICGWREDEALELGQIFDHVAKVLAYALASFIDDDVEVAATINQVFLDDDGMYVTQRSNRFHEDPSETVRGNPDDDPHQVATPPKYQERERSASVGIIDNKAFDLSSILDPGGIDTRKRLIETVDDNAKFLAEVYYYGGYAEKSTFQGLGIVDDKLIATIERAIKLQPSKVDAAAAVFAQLATVYENINIKGYNDVNAVREYGHWTGNAAHGFEGSFERLLNHVGQGGEGAASLRAVARATSTLLHQFAESLRKWQKAVEEVIRETAKAKKEMEKELVGELFDLGVSATRGGYIEVVAQAADALWKGIMAIDAQGKERDLIWFKAFIDTGGIDSVEANFVQRKEYTLDKPFEPRLR